jgi:rhodanese-related sulfurtransferase
MSILSSLFGLGKEQSDKSVVLDVVSYANAISKPKVQLVDVRTPEEFNKGHIENAINIDFRNKEVFEKLFAKLNKNKPVYVYCRSGARSQRAARKLVEMGFLKIYDLEGGYMSWAR